MHGCGETQKRFGIFVGPARIEVSLPNVAGPYKSLPIRNASAFDGGFVAIGLCDGPGGHKAARAPAEHGEPIRISPALGDGVIGGTIHVAIGAIAEVLVNSAHEFGAVAGGAAILGLQNDIAHAGKYPGTVVELERVVQF